MSDTLQSQINAIENSDQQTVPIEQVKDLIASVKGMFGSHFENGQGTVDNKELYTELGELARFINTARKELNEVRSSNLTDKEIPDASNQLDQIVKMTEQATGQIMDKCEQLQNMHKTVRERLVSADPPVDPDVMAGVDDAFQHAETSLTQIYEACNFQDITGQRIQKVVKALHEIERQVLRMVVVFGLDQHEDLDADTRRELQEGASLLSGPADKGQGLEQDDIDDILNKLL